jgi:hypothetical protein
MTYAVKVLPRADREAIIKKQLATPQGEEDFYDSEVKRRSFRSFE